MSTTIPRGAAELIAESDNLSAALDGYGPSEIDGVYTRQGSIVTPQGIEIVGEGAGVWIDEHATVELTSNIRGRNSSLVIGRRCRLRKLTVHIDGDDIAVVIGAGSTVEQAVILVAPAGNSVVIGDDAMISSGVVIRTDDGHSVWDRRTGEKLSEPAPVRIGTHVWLGNGSRIGKGVTIGDGTVVGQQSIMTKNADAHSSYAGIPARKLRDDVAWSRTRSFNDIPGTVLFVAELDKDERAHPKQSLIRKVRRLLRVRLDRRQRP
ncbi:acyltransferase [Arthrobacter sp. AQ5-05]|uniref:acyltransferase n=1 Tax=Arthrobacter sp. AQ5-05 TaxID=2184581 RepID=UPI0012B662A5|nr:acyltransferase [Arthrobacter sp. AQ5-05]